LTKQPTKTQNKQTNDRKPKHCRSGQNPLPSTGNYNTVKKIIKEKTFVKHYNAWWITEGCLKSFAKKNSLKPSKAEKPLKTKQ